MHFFKMDNSTKRLFEVVIDDLDEVLPQEVRNSVEDAIDITDMFEFGGPSLVMARRFAAKKGEKIYIFDYVLFFS